MQRRSGQGDHKLPGVVLKLKRATWLHGDRDALFVSGKVHHGGRDALFVLGKARHGGRDALSMRPPTKTNRTERTKER